MTQTETYIRKPFQVEVVELTLENIKEIAPTIGKLRYKDTGEPWIKADPEIIPNVRNVFVGYFLTDNGQSKRCFSPKAFHREYMESTPQWLEWIQQLDLAKTETQKDVVETTANEKESDMGSSSMAEAGGNPENTGDAELTAMEELPVVDPSVTEAAEAAMSGMTADERAVVEDHLAIPGVGEALAKSLAKGDVEEVLPTEEERAAAGERMAKVQESLGIPDLSEERAEEMAEPDGSEIEEPKQDHGVVCGNCGSKNLTPVGRGYSCNGCGHHEVNLDGARTEPRNVFEDKAPDAGL